MHKGNVLFATALAGLTLSHAGPLEAQQAGRWVVAPGGYVDPEHVLTESERAAAVALLDRLILLVQANPALREPEGVEVRTGRTVEHYPNAGVRTRPDVVRSHLSVALFPLLDNGQPAGHATARIQIHVNPSSGWPGLREVARDSVGPMFRADPSGAVTATFATWVGTPTNVSAWRRQVLVVPPGAETHVPVTLERWLRHLVHVEREEGTPLGLPAERYREWVAGAPQRLAAIRSAAEIVARTDTAGARLLLEQHEHTEAELGRQLRDPTGPIAAAANQSRARLDALTRRLEGLSPAERAAPVWLDKLGEIVAPGTPGASHVVAPDPAFYPSGTGGLPRAIIVDFNAFKQNLQPLLQASFEQFDWEAVGALIQPAGEDRPSRG